MSQTATNDVTARSQAMMPGDRDAERSRALRSALRMIVGAAMLLLILLPLFVDLGKPVIRTWDESRNAVNAVEMARNHQWLVRYYADAPDMWQAKPPLLTWLQVAALNVSGWNEAAIRAPVALAAALTALLLVVVGGILLGSWLTGAWAGLVLVTIPGYVGPHVARTGDIDGLLVLFTTAYAFVWYKYLERNDSRGLLAMFAVAVILAVLTKGVAGVMLLPGLLAYTVWSGKLRALLKRPDTYVAMAVTLAVPLGYYLWREHVNPGYLQAVWEGELGGRYLSTLEGHRAPFYYYARELLLHRLGDWAFLIPGLLLLGLLRSPPAARRLMGYSLTLIFSFLLVISFARTKLPWYDAPALPFIAVIGGIGVEALRRTLVDALRPGGEVQRALVMAVFTLTVFGYPYRAVIAAVRAMAAAPSAAENERSDEKYALFVKALRQEQPQLKHYTIAYFGYPAVLMFYKAALEWRSDYHIDLRITLGEPFPIGELLVVCDRGTGAILEMEHRLQPLASTSYGCELARLESRR